MSTFDVILLPQYQRTFDLGRLMEWDYYKKLQLSIPEGKRIETIMINDSFIACGDDFVYTNDTKEKAYVLHREGDALAKSLLYYKMGIPFMENTDQVDMMRYKEVVLP